MAEADWTELLSSLSTGDVLRGASAGFVPPNGGGSFVYGFNSITATPGVVGRFANLVDFAPMAKGGRITGAVQRGISGGDAGFAPFLFIGLQGSDVSDVGYMLGMSDEAPHHIVLRKGALDGGIPNDDPGTNGVLAKSTLSYPAGTWLHLRLDVVVNLNGDVVLLAFASDLGANTVAAPVWEEIPGMEWAPAPDTGRVYIDDVAGVNSGSAPYPDGRVGFGFQSADVARRGFFDHVTVSRQL